MPYLPEYAKEVLDYSPETADSPGDLNYIFTQQIRQYLQNEGTSYTTLNAAIGALECCKLELYRRLAAPYEDTKIKENGDVYD